MSDRQLTIALPAELIAKLEDLTDDVPGLIVRAIEHEIATYRTPDELELDQWGRSDLTLAEKEALLHKLLPPARLAEGLQLLHAGQPIPGLLSGRGWTSEDFDAPLPDEEWGDLFQ